MDYGNGTALYRVEAAFDGEYQGCGLFSALYEIGLPEGYPERIELLFHGLEKPIVSEPCVFWFTRAGMLRFRDALVFVAVEMEEYNWSLLVAKTTLDDGDVLYRDEYQVALKKSTSPATSEDYVEMTPEALDGYLDELEAEAGDGD